MKRSTTIKLITACFVSILFLICPRTGLLAQETSYTSSLELNTIKNGDGSRTLKAILLSADDENEYPVLKAEIFYYSVQEEEKLLLGKSFTDKDGKTTYIISPEQKLLKNKEGLVTILAEFKGSNALSTAEAFVEFMDIDFRMSLTEEDSIKTITVFANGIGSNGELIPLMETDIYFYIQGMFSRLKIGEGWMDNGECIFEFPTTLKGDELGNLTIFASLEDHSDYGTAIATEKAQWGTHRSNYSEPSRTLWTRGAPVWMIVTLTILLIGVWSHYFYAIVQLFLVRKEGLKLKNRNNEAS